VKKANNQLENEFDLDDNKQSEMSEVIFFNHCNNIEELKLKNSLELKTDVFCWFGLLSYIFLATYL
jgi:hypothetical protein